MAGSYDPNNPPIRRGFYSRIVAAAEEAVLGGSGGVVAMPIVHDSGPTGEFHEITDSAGFDAIFGDSDTDDRLAVIGALTGTGEAESGASAVIVYRMPLSGQVAAAKTLTNTTPANALTLTAKHKGTRGNDISYTVRDHPGDAAQDQLLIYENGVLQETFNYPNTNITALGALVNDSVTGSDYVTATVLISGVALATATSQALDGTTGADGSPVGSDYIAAESAFEAQPFNIFVIPNMTDTGILASARTWVQGLNDTSRRVMFVEAGGSSDGVSDAITRSALTSTDGDFVNFGYNKFVSDATGTTYSGAQMIGYFAGIIAGVGVTGSITFARLAGFDLDATQTALTNSDVEDAIEGGVVVFTKDARGIRIEAEVTTFTDDSDEDHPLDVFGSIKSVRTLHQIENDFTEITEEDWIGEVSNTEAARDSYLATLLQYLKTMEDEGALKPGTSEMRFDETQDNTGDTLYPIYYVEMASAIERVLAIGQVA